MENKIKLLVVDDEVAFLNSISKRLELRDFDVTKAICGSEAVKFVSENKFDLALIDLKMPGMSGQELLEILKREHKYLEVIILTGHGSLESAVQCTKMGAHSYLPKPYELDQLIKLLISAYRTRLQKKFENDMARIEKIQQIAAGESALGILRILRELDDDEK